MVTLKGVKLTPSTLAEQNLRFWPGRTPDHTTVYRFLRRLKEEDLDKALAEVVKRFPRYKGRRSIVALDSTGLTFQALSSYFQERRKHHSQKTNKPLTYYWLKWLVAVDVGRHLLLRKRLMPDRPTIVAVCPN